MYLRAHQHYRLNLMMEEPRPWSSESKVFALLHKSKNDREHDGWIQYVQTIIPSGDFNLHSKDEEVVLFHGGPS